MLIWIIVSLQFLFFLVSVLLNGFRLCKDVFELFYMYSSSIHSFIPVVSEPNQDSSSVQVPQWLRSLVCCASFLQSAEFSIHSTAVAAVVDLASLLLTSLEVQKNFDRGGLFASNVRVGKEGATEDRKEQDMVFVMIRPLVTEMEFRALLVDTLVTQVRH